MGLAMEEGMQVKRCFACDEKIAYGGYGEYWDLRSGEAKRMSPQAWRNVKYCPPCAKKRKDQRTLECIHRRRRTDRQYRTYSSKALDEAKRLVDYAEYLLAKAGAI